MSWSKSYKSCPKNPTNRPHSWPKSRRRCCRGFLRSADVGTTVYFETGGPFMSRRYGLIQVVFLLSAFSAIFTTPAGAADVKVIELVPDDVLAVLVVPQLKNFDAKIS